MYQMLFRVTTARLQDCLFFINLRGGPKFPLMSHVRLTVAMYYFSEWHLPV